MVAAGVARHKQQRHGQIQRTRASDSRHLNARSILNAQDPRGRRPHRPQGLCPGSAKSRILADRYGPVADSSYNAVDRMGTAEHGENHDPPPPTCVCKTKLRPRNT